MGITRTNRKQIAAEAVDWFMELHDSAADEARRHGFTEWLLRSPLHVEEYLRTSSAWQLLHIGSNGDLATDALVAAAQSHHETDNVVRLSGRFGPRNPYARASRQLSFGSGWMRALAASLVLAGIALSMLYLRSQPVTFQTVIGEQRSFSLQDGSVVFLNTHSKVRVAWLSNERHIELVRGEARFKVAKDPARPFIVATSTAAVRAIGTLFNVRAEPLSTQVAVLEGQVDVTQTPPHRIGSPDPAEQPASAAAHPLSSIRLGAGERAAVTSVGIEPDAGPSIEAVSAWTDRHLVFRDQQLSSVIAEFNRYRTQPLVLDDPQLAALKIGGVFDLSDPDSLIAYLGAYETVQVDRRPDGSQHLSRRPLLAPIAK